MEDKSAGRGFLILAIAGLLGKVLSAIYMPSLIAILGSTGYGIYQTSYQIFIFILAITSMGVQPAVTKVVTELRAIGNHEDALKAMKVTRKYLGVVGLIVTIIFLLLIGPISNLFNAPGARLALIILSPTIALSVILSVYRGYLQGMEKMTILATSQLLEQLVTIILSLSCAFILAKTTMEFGGMTLNSGELGSAGGTVGAAVGALVAIIFIIYIFEKYDYENEAIENSTSDKRVSSKKVIKKVIKYALPISLVAAMQNAAALIDVALVNKILTEEYTGILSTYKTLIYVPLIIVTALGVSIFPKIIQSFVQKDRKELKKHMTYSFRLTYIIAIPAAFGLSILSKEIYTFLLPKAIEGYSLLTYGAVVLIFMSITSIQNTVLQGINKLYLILCTSGIGIVIKIICDYVLLPIESLNVMGAVIGDIFAFLVPAIINHIQLQKFFKVKIPIIKQAIVPLISSIIMIIVIFLLKEPLVRLVGILNGGRVLIAIVTMILIAVGGLIYLYVMVYFGGIRRRDLDMISPKIYTLMPRHLRKQMI